ncbi:unnamed protein product [Didymodactylos carnosus]|uniref:Uncharacterized protein n=1 Tax=Didymodactylos carnosus TaxID=1234261 RepID=A0A814NZM0_9BILA|nr:unnamed protein product [Didymodactylos carnosus]CAF3863056.1 unnamed protein product [Didymodactylos carnosus]
MLFVNVVLARNRNNTLICPNHKTDSEILALLPFRLQIASNDYSQSSAAQSSKNEVIGLHIQRETSSPIIFCFKNLYFLQISFTNLSDEYYPSRYHNKLSQTEMKNSRKYSSLLKLHIGKLKLTLNVLSLFNIPFDHVPSEIIRLKNLTTLRIEHAGLKHLPSSISELQELKELYLAVNKISSLPSEIVLLKKLKLLEISYNLIYEMELVLSLTTLFISGLKLKMLPYFPLLLNLSMTDSNLSSLKNFQLSPSLTFLVLTQNNFHGKIPDEILSLTKLEQLYLHLNSITDLSGISRLKMLKQLNLRNNKLNTVSSEIMQLNQTLKWLSLANNNLTVLPNELVHLRKLEHLYLFGNQFSFEQILKIRTMFTTNKKIKIYYNNFTN